MHNLSLAFILDCVRFFIKWKLIVILKCMVPSKFFPPSIGGCGEDVPKTADLTYIAIYGLDPVDFES